MDEFNLHEWEKEKLDKIVESEKIRLAEERGILEANVKAAKRMLSKGMNIKDISEVTNLSIEEITKLSEDKND